MLVQGTVMRGKQQYNAMLAVVVSKAVDDLVIWFVTLCWGFSLSSVSLSLSRLLLSLFTVLH